MIELIPTKEDLEILLGVQLLKVWEQLCEHIEEKYEMEKIWNKGFRDWVYEYKYRRGGKTLCTFYMKNQMVSFWVILGKEERNKFDEKRDEFSKEIQKIYDETETYRDGKWLMFNVEDTTLFDDFEKLLFLKRKPNRK